jgi:hypothetical protein
MKHSVLEWVVLFFNFGLIGCKSTKKCAKWTILNIKVKIRKFEGHQKIPWARFAGNDISNYGLISNRNGAKDQKITFNLFLESAVFKVFHRTQGIFW